MKISAIFPLLLLVCSVFTSAENAEVQLPYLQEVHAVLREMSASLAQQKLEMRFLQKLNQGHAAKLKQQKIEIDKLNKTLQVKQVAFSASLLGAGAGETGPFPTFKTLIFEHVITDIGNAYNKHTGVFTAPVRGAYHFEWHIGTHGGGGGRATAVLVKNLEHIFTADEYQSNLYGSSSNGATLLLEVGDDVFVRLWHGSRVYDSPDHRTTFSGHLLFTM